LTGGEEVTKRVLLIALATLRATASYYNFSRVHKTLRVILAMETGIPDHIWTIADLIAG
jgi:hypothetical protein